MKKILFVMDRKVLAEALMIEMKHISGAAFSKEYNYKRAAIAAEVFQPNIMLLEIPESKKISLHQCLEICNDVRKILPECKILLLTPENSKDAREMAIKAVQDGNVNDFIYYDTSMEYLKSKLKSM